MLSEWDPDSGDVDRFHCSYYLGQPLFQDLLASMDVETFREKLGELYQLSLEAQAADRTPSIAEVRQAFAGRTASSTTTGPGNLTPRRTALRRGYERTNHDLIQWEQYPTFVDGVVELKGVLLGDSILVSKDATEISLFEFAAFRLRSVDGGANLGSILPPPRTAGIGYLTTPVMFRPPLSPSTRLTGVSISDSSSQPLWVTRKMSLCVCWVIRTPTGNPP